MARWHAVLGLCLPCCVHVHRIDSQKPHRKTSRSLLAGQQAWDNSSVSWFTALTAGPRVGGEGELQGIFPRKAAHEMKALRAGQPHARVQVRVPTSGHSKSHSASPSTDGCWPPEAQW